MRRGERAGTATLADSASRASPRPDSRILRGIIEAVLSRGLCGLRGSKPGTPAFSESAGYGSAPYLVSSHPTSACRSVTRMDSCPGRPQSKYGPLAQLVEHWTFNP